MAITKNIPTVNLTRNEMMNISLASSLSQFPSIIEAKVIIVVEVPKSANETETSISDLAVLNKPKSLTDNFRDMIKIAKALKDAENIFPTNTTDSCLPIWLARSFLTLGIVINLSIRIRCYVLGEGHERV